MKHSARISGNWVFFNHLAYECHKFGIQVLISPFAVELGQLFRNQTKKKGYLLMVKLVELKLYILSYRPCKLAPQLDCHIWQVPTPTTIQWEKTLSKNQALSGYFLECRLGWTPFQHPPRHPPNSSF